MRAEHVSQLEELQRLVFPTLAEEERLHAWQYLRHLEVFPEGQFVLLEQATKTADVEQARADKEAEQAGADKEAEQDAGIKVIGMTTTMRTDPDFNHPHHTFADMFGKGLLEHHQPQGPWLYGLDFGIHPAYRGRGLSRLLYRARQQLVETLGLQGQLTVGMMNGYGAAATIASELTGEEYYRQWLQGTRTDPTLTPQRKIGFRPLALIPGYLHDPVCGNYGVLLRLDRGQPV